MDDDRKGADARSFPDYRQISIFTALYEVASIARVAARLGMNPSTVSMALARLREIYQDDLFVAFHGSWNTTLASARDCKVQRILIQNGQPTGSESFVNGFRAPGETCGGANTFGRPADVVVNSAGEMFISDDYANAIYRVIYVGP